MERIAYTVVVALACAGFTSVGFAQGGKLGAYTGTVSLSGSEIGKYEKIDFAAKVKVSIPVESVKDGSVRAEAEDIDKPSAVATITKWEQEGRASSPGADGKIMTWKCSLAAPVDVPANAQGSLDLDTRTKKYTMYVALAPLKPFPVNCVNSQSGAYKDKKGIGLFFGTSEPELIPANAQSFADPARIAAKYKFVPAASAKGKYGPVDMEWDLRLQK